MSNGRALILDDSPILRWQLQQELQQLQFSVAHLKAETDPALCQAEVIFVELVQKSGNGFHILRQLISRVNCPLILISGSGRASDRYWASQSGAVAILERPVSAKTVRAVLEQAGFIVGQAE